MLRAILPSGRKSLFLVIAVIAIGAVWWWQRPPPDLKDHGLWLSEYLYRGSPNTTDPRPPEEQIRAYGPAGVKWLIGKLEHGRIQQKPAGPLPLDKAPGWLRRRTSERWGGTIVPIRNERLNAACLLKWLWPDAAPAIPALVRTLDLEGPKSGTWDEGQWTAWQAAKALHAIGPAAAPTIREILDHGSPRARAALAGTIWTGPRDFGRRPSEPEIASMLGAFIEATHDPSPEVRVAAAMGVGNEEGARRFGGEPDLGTYDSTIPVLIQLLSEQDESVLVAAVMALKNFADKAAPAVPRLIELLDHQSPLIRRLAAYALSAADKAEGRSIPRLRLMLQDSDSQCRSRARDALTELAYAMGLKGGTSGSPPPAQ